MECMTIIAGNCVLENNVTSLKTARYLTDHSKRYGYNLIYKSSWRKDNRSSIKHYEGPPIKECTEIFECLKAILGNIGIITDFHDPEELHHSFVEYIDILQIPAYLCMQTRLLDAMVNTGKSINIKKGQFICPSDVINIVNKINDMEYQKEILITERGTCFGYRDLVFDPRSIHILKQISDIIDCNIFFDAGHCVRKYGVPSSNIESGGEKQYIPTLAKAAIAAGADGIFVEVHPDPDNAKCDAATQLDFGEYDSMILSLLPIWKAIRKRISV
jgi:2-dehydro-3-deoxyphosphooctonate aldolase (KDO 8-P synthase)